MPDIIDLSRIFSQSLILIFGVLGIYGVFMERHMMMHWYPETFLVAVVLSVLLYRFDGDMGDRLPEGYEHYMAYAAAVAGPVLVVSFTMVSMMAVREYGVFHAMMDVLPDGLWDFLVALPVVVHILAAYAIYDFLPQERPLARYIFGALAFMLLFLSFYAGGIALFLPRT